MRLLVLIGLMVLLLLAFSSWGRGDSEDGFEVVPLDEWSLDLSGALSNGSRSAMFQVQPIAPYGERKVYLVSGWFFFPANPDRSDEEGFSAEVKLYRGADLLRTLKLKLFRRGGYLYLQPFILMLPKGTYKLIGPAGAEIRLPQDLFNHFTSPLCLRYSGKLDEIAAVVSATKPRGSRLLKENEVSEELNSRSSAYLLVRGVVKDLVIKRDEIRVELEDEGPVKAIYLGKLPDGNFKLSVILKGKVVHERKLEVKR